MTKKAAQIPDNYKDWVFSLKHRIAGARQHALLNANAEQIQLYHDIILDRQTKQGWGAKVIDRLRADLRDAFPEMKGLSTTNLKYMRVFVERSPDRLIGQRSTDQLPWFHIVTLITKLSGIDKPLGVAEYQLLRSLLKPLDTSLPTIEELERELSRDLDGEKKS